MQGPEPELARVFLRGLSPESEESNCTVTPRCRQDHEPHRFNYASANFIHLVKPGSYKKSYFQVRWFNYGMPFINHCTQPRGQGLLGSSARAGLQPPAL